MYSIDLYWPMSLAVGTTDAALVVVVVVVVVVDDDGWKLARARRDAAPGPAGCGGDGKEEDEEAEEDEEEEPAMDTSASDIIWSNDGSIGSLRLAESLSGITLISLSDITPKSWPGKVPLVVVLADDP